MTNETIVVDEGTLDIWTLQESSLWLQGQAPTRGVGLICVGHAPELLSLNLKELPSEAVLSVDGQIPILFVEKNRAPGDTSLVLTGYARDPLINWQKEPAAGSVSITGVLPTIDTEDFRVADPNVGSLSLFPEAPLTQTSTNTTIGPLRKKATISGKVPTLDQEQNLWVGVSVGSMSLVGIAPSQSKSFSFSVAAGSISLAGKIPYSLGAKVFVPLTGGITFSTYLTYLIFEDTELFLTGQVPSVSMGYHYIPTTGNLEMEQHTALVETEGIKATPSYQLRFQSHAPTFSTTTKFEPGARIIVSKTVERELEFIGLGKTVG